MNLLLLRPEECVSETRAVMRGERAAALVKEHALKAGLSIRAGMRGGKLGRALIRSASKDLVEAELELNEKPLARHPILLAIGICRPQTVKKVIQAVTTLGAAELHFVRTESAEKSYFSSQALHEDAIKEEIDKGLSQAVDTEPPIVTVQKKFLSFFEDFLPARLKELHWEEEGGTARVIAATRVQSSALAAVGGKKQRFVAAVGPEAGWSEFEENRLLELGFKPITLGERVLRVETAVTALIAQIQLITSTGG